jgi:hypothetical protein
VFTLVEREGSARSRHVADVTGDTLREAMVTRASRKSYLMTDSAPVYTGIGREFSGTARSIAAPTNMCGREVFTTPTPSSHSSRC